MRAPGAHPFIVVAEDDDRLRWCLAESMTRLGWRVLELEDAFELEDYLRFVQRMGNPEGLPDLLLSDVRMPGGSGLELLQRARATGFVRPVVVLTAFPSPELARGVAELGEARLVGKPASMREVTALITSLLR